MKLDLSIRVQQIVCFSFDYCRQFAAIDWSVHIHFWVFVLSTFYAYETGQHKINLYWIWVYEMDFLAYLCFVCSCCVRRVRSPSIRSMNARWEKWLLLDSIVRYDSFHTYIIYITCNRMRLPAVASHHHIYNLTINLCV